MAETFFYLTTTGRVSGQAHTIEIWYVELNECYYLCAEHAYASDWVKNIQSDNRVLYHLGTSRSFQPESRVVGTAHVVEDSDVLQHVRALFNAKYDWSSGLMVAICPQQ